jgi:membrane protease YdiL (CAAX protease family)
MLIGGFTSFLFVSLGLYLLPVVVFHSWREPYKMLAIGCTAGALNFAYLAYRRTLAGRSWADFGFVQPTFRDAGLGILIAATTLASCFVIPTFSLNPSAAEFNKLSSAVSGPFALTVYLAGLVGAAFSEECIFRAYLIPSLETRFRPAYAVLLSSALFGLIHLQFAVRVFIGGVIFGSVFIRRRSIWPVVIGHFLHNVAGTLIAYFLLERVASR